MKELIAKYIDSKQMAWEKSTLRSEAARLTANQQGLTVGPEAYFKILQQEKKLKPYTIKTIFIRLSDFQQWLLANGQTSDLSFRNFLKTNKKLFKGAYTKEVIGVTYEEARRRVQGIKDEALRLKAEQLLLSGARWEESSTLDHNQRVLGKGRKARRLFNVNRVEWQGSYKKFLRELKRETGLKPHSLRKLFATHLVNNGVKEADLMKIMGWSSMASASSYLQSKRDDELQELLGRLISA